MVCFGRPLFLAQANPQAYGQSFQKALKNGASYDQALIRATADSTMRILGNQVPMGRLLFKIGGDPNKAVSLIRDATMQVGIYMTPGELNLLGIIAAEASAYQRDGSFTQKIAIEMLKGNFREQAWTAASEILWKEATDRVIAHGIADVISRDAGKGQPVETIDTRTVEIPQNSPTYEELVQKGDIPVVDIGRNTEGKTYAQLKADVFNKAIVEKWYDSPYTNKDTGMPVFLTRNSLTHAFGNLSAQFGTDTILAMGNAPELIQNAVLVNIAPPKNLAKAETRVLTFLAAINGENGVEPVKLTVKEYDSNRPGHNIPQKILEYFTKQKRSDTYNTLYDLKALEVVGIESAKKEFGDSASATNSLGLPGAKSSPNSEISASVSVAEGLGQSVANNTPNSSIRVSDLMTLVKGDAEKYIPKTAKEKRFQDLLAKAKKGDIIEFDDELEDIVAGKSFEELKPLIEKLPNRAARKWYIAQNNLIPSQIDRSLDLEGQARQAFDLRKQNRIRTRDLMADQEARRELDTSEPNLTFEEMVNDKIHRKKIGHEEALEDIIRTATKTRKSVNDKLGVGG